MSELFTQAILIAMFAATVRIAAPLLLVSIGELVVQRAGIWFLGVEGSMLMAAFAAYFISVASDSLSIGLFAGIGMGITVHLSMAVATVTLKINQFITGLGINLLASGLTLLLYRESLKRFNGEVPTVIPFETVALPGISQIPILGEIFFDQHIFTYLAFAMVGVVWAFLYRTRYGLEIRALGENPKALDIKGLSVSGRQYAALAFGGTMAGLAGAVLVLALTDRFVPNMTNGRGWLAIVIIIAGNWKPLPILVAVLVFAFLEAFQLQAQGIGLDIPYQLLLALPYIGAIVAMIRLQLRSEQPAHLGVPYHRE